MNKVVNDMAEADLEQWLQSKLKNKWSNRDIRILAKILKVEYLKNNKLQKKNRSDRDYFTKMLIKAKLQKGIPPDQ